jgi:hypothetical protein
MYEAIPVGGSQESEPASTLSSKVFKYFVYILTAPFLGMMVYSLASLLSSTNVFVLSVVSFSVGFISDGVVETMVSFSNSLLKRALKTPAAGALGAENESPAPPDTQAMSTSPEEQTSASTS